MARAYLQSPTTSHIAPSLSSTIIVFAEVYSALARGMARGAYFTMSTAHGAPCVLRVCVFAFAWVSSRGCLVGTPPAR